MLLDTLNEVFFLLTPAIQELLPIVEATDVMATDVESCVSHT